MAGNYCDLLGGECATLAERDERHELERVFHCDKCGDIVNVTKVTCSKCSPGAYGPRRPVIGVAAIVQDTEGRVLVSERRSGKMQGWYGAPGGHLEWIESFEEAAVRELKEEAGIDAHAVNCEVIGVDQDYDPNEDHHWAIVFVRVKRWTGKPTAAEPGKRGPWEWYHPAKLPKKTLRPLVSIGQKLASDL